MSTLPSLADVWPRHEGPSSSLCSWLLRPHEAIAVKDYPSIPSARGQQFREIPGALLFDKKDGSSMRSEWNHRKGWYKHGRRTGLLDDSNSDLSAVPLLFEQQLAEPLARIARDARWQSLVVFYEFWGRESVAGLHVAGDPKFLTVFDCAPENEMLGPAEFRKAFEEHVPTAEYLGTMNWTRGLVDEVRRGELAGVTMEGVVGKAGGRRGQEIVRAKAKTQAWIDRVLLVHGAQRGGRLIES
jgi:hypothetical protein